MVGSLSDDTRDHSLRPIASFTQRATDRLSTSRCIRSSVTSFLNRPSSWRSDSDSTPSSSARALRSLATQFPRVPSFTPNSRAI